MPGIPLPAIDDITLRKKTQHRKIQEMFAEILTVRNTITNVYNNGSGLIKVTTNGVHGLSTGDKVIIDAVLGCTEANGFWTVTQTSTTEFTLDSSAFTNAWTSGGNVCDGQSYSIVMASSCTMLVSVDLKQIDAGVVTPLKVVKKITTTTETEIFRSDAVSSLAISCLSITNNSGSSESGSIKLRTTKAQSSLSEILTPFTLPDGHKLVVGGDGVQSMYLTTGLPYVS